MFTCRDATDLMLEAEEGALAGWTGFRYRLHLSICAHCRACRRQTGEAVAIAKSIPAEQVPPEVEESALSAFRARSRKP
jgi:hypothetical protein